MCTYTGSVAKERYRSCHGWANRQQELKYFPPTDVALPMSWKREEL